MPDPVLSPCTRREPPPLPGGVGLGGSAGHRSGFPLWDIFEWAFMLANEVLSFIEENDVKFIRLAFTDLFGRPPI